MSLKVAIQNRLAGLRRAVVEHPLTQHRLFRPVTAAGLAALAGLLLWHAPPGEPWRNASYDYLFRFGSQRVTNRVVIIYLDNQAYADYASQQRGLPWSRKLHAQLLEKLTADRCSWVVFDAYLGVTRDPDDDAALAEAMRRHGRVVLMARHTRTENRNLIGARPRLPHDLFLAAAQTNWGVAFFDPDPRDGIVRQHWPFPSPGPYPSLPWAAAGLAGASLDKEPEQRWLRFYGQDGPWTRLSYKVAFTQATNFFRDAIVVIGNKPATTVPDNEEDEFQIPYTRWTGETVGGVDLLATAFLNLRNDEWLRRPSPWLEAFLMLLAALALGAGLCALRPGLACLAALGAALLVTLCGATLSQLTNYWFPWLVVAGGQVPVALGWAMATRRLRWPAWKPASAALRRTLPGVPDALDYEIIGDPFGEGHFGKVWLARNAVGQWQALKAVYRAKFGNDAGPYETEFKGITRYKPVSDKHPGLLRVDFVSKPKDEGYFYYVMELGDSLTPGWENNPKLYQPRDLARARDLAPGRRLPPLECICVGVELAEALDFLHGAGLTHRDIKPGNVVFVNGRPKLADVGLIGYVKPPEKVTTWAGTPGYMPPLPEPPGTIVADIYGLGMLLYVISTGDRPVSFPKLKTVLMENSQAPQFMRLNSVILRACDPKPEERFASAAELRKALLDIDPQTKR